MLCTYILASWWIYGGTVILGYPLNKHAYTHITHYVLRTLVLALVRIYHHLPPPPHTQIVRDSSTVASLFMSSLIVAL